MFICDTVGGVSNQASCLLISCTGQMHKSTMFALGKHKLDGLVGVGTGDALYQALLSDYIS